MNKREHSPQDQIYGPLSIPSYCWPIIDTTEFQRMRYLLQLGAVVYVYPGTNHTRFEHSLGCAHLAGTFLSHFEQIQPELKIDPKHKKATIIAALCHDLGHGPYSFTFDRVAQQTDPTWDHRKMSCSILREIVEKYTIDIEEEVIEAACSFIMGQEYEGYPKFLANIVNNQECDIDVNKFDYLSRDMNRSINTGRFDYDRLIYNCRVINDKLCWKISEIPTLERFFFNFNNMCERVYKHRVVQAIEVMMQDVFEKVFEQIDLQELLEDPSVFVGYDDRMLMAVEQGEYGDETKTIMERIIKRDLYQCIGYIRIRADNTEGIRYSQKNPKSIEEDLLDNFAANIGENPVRVVSTRFRYGLREDRHPLLVVPFYRDNEEIHLQPHEITSITPQIFSQKALRVYVTKKSYRQEAEAAYAKWAKGIFFLSNI